MQAASARVWALLAANCTIRGRSSGGAKQKKWLHNRNHNYKTFKVSKLKQILQSGNSRWLVVNSLSLALVDWIKSEATIIGVKHTSQLYFLTKDLNASLGTNDITAWMTIKKNNGVFSVLKKSNNASVTTAMLLENVLSWIQLFNLLWISDHWSTYFQDFAFFKQLHYIGEYVNESRYSSIRSSC